MSSANDTKVFVGLSGGVDSSVTAALLLRAGFKVTGVFIKVWEPPAELAGGVCTWREDRRDAMRTAAKLQIPFFTLDLSTEYKQLVVDEMIAQYRTGRTPNPDILCNQKIKFGLFFDWAKTAGADLVATGHYAKIIDGKLYRGQDPQKDQSYWLWTLRPEELPFITLPLGSLTKTEVRAQAKKFNLPTANKKDSQGLCFLGKLNVREFLAEFIDIQPGPVVDQAGRIIGRHQGVVFYTIGQRHGFQINQPASQPLYVLGKDVASNTLLVGPTLSTSPLAKTKVNLDQINWLAQVDTNKDYLAQIRYRSEPRPGRFKPPVSFEFSQSQADIAPGQSLVIYDQDQVIGGGVIV